jgi:hypothetical protein
MRKEAVAAENALLTAPHLICSLVCEQSSSILCDIDAWIKKDYWVFAVDISSKTMPLNIEQANNDHYSSSSKSQKGALARSEGIERCRAVPASSYALAEDLEGVTE